MRYSIATKTSTPYHVNWLTNVIGKCDIVQNPHAPEDKGNQSVKAQRRSWHFPMDGHHRDK
jgi:hypothetical protein